MKDKKSISRILFLYMFLFKDMQYLYIENIDIFIN